MADLELSVMYRGTETAHDLAPTLDAFERTHGVRVRVRVLQWETGWADLVKVALYGQGPDVSEIGSTWVGNLIAMNGLRPYAATEVEELGGPDAYVPAAWAAGQILGEQQMWALPWLADTRVLYYRGDLLADAGVDEATLHTTAGLAQALEQLRAHGVEAPWAVPTSHSLTTMHNLASWVWEAGGDFVSPDGKRVLFNEPRSRAGMRAYFDLYRYLGPHAGELDADQPNYLFRQGRTAMTMSGPWVWAMGIRRQQEVVPEVLENLRMALAPGVPFLGGSNLVVWRHTKLERAAVRLAMELAGPDAQATYPRRVGMLPVRMGALASPSTAHDALLRVSGEGLKRGRAFPSFSLWGLVEDKLSAALSAVWSDVLSVPEPNIDRSLNRHLDPIAGRLAATLRG